MSAGIALPEASRTATSVVPSTTWLLVTILPASSQTNPVPDCTPSLSSLAKYPPPLRPTTCTTEGDTRSNTAMIDRSASERLPRGSIGRGAVGNQNQQEFC